MQNKIKFNQISKCLIVIWVLIISISCKDIMRPKEIHKTIVASGSNYVHTEEVWETNYQIYYTYNTNNKDGVIPELSTVSIISEYGYFGATRRGKTFTIPVYTEEFDNFEQRHIQLFSDIMTSRAAITVKSKGANTKYITVTLLGGNIQTNQYEVYIKREPNTTAEYTKWKQLASEGQSTKNLWYGLTVNGQFKDYGSALLLSRTGNRGGFNNNSYSYSLVRVVGSGDTCIYKNRDTGSFICVKIKTEGGVKKLYLVKPHNGQFVIQGGDPYNASVGSAIFSLLVFSKSFLWARSSLVGAVGFSTDIINLIWNGGYMNNNELSIKDITASGYLMKNYDWDTLLYWGKYDF